MRKILIYKCFIGQSTLIAAGENGHAPKGSVKILDSVRETATAVDQIKFVKQIVIEMASIFKIWKKHLHL